MRNFLRTFIHPEHEEDPEHSEISEAANILQVGEFQLLQLAYFDWHGQELSEKEQNRLFAAYMLDKQVTPWMRHYARKIIELNAQGQLDFQDPVYHRYDHEFGKPLLPGQRHFIWVVLLLLLAIVGIIILSMCTVQKSGSVFPPYFGDQELRVIQADGKTMQQTPDHSTALFKVLSRIRNESVDRVLVL